MAKKVISGSGDEPRAAKFDVTRALEKVMESTEAIYRRELEAGQAFAEQAEEIHAWFAFNEARKRWKKPMRKREEFERRTGTIPDEALVDLPRPIFLN
jgi:hypothetical protein